MWEECRPSLGRSLVTLVDNAVQAKLRTPQACLAWIEVCIAFYLNRRSVTHRQYQLSPGTKGADSGLRPTFASRHRIQAVFLFMRIGADGSVVVGTTGVPLIEAITSDFVTRRSPYGHTFEVIMSCYCVLGKWQHRFDRASLCSWAGIGRFRRNNGHPNLSHVTPC